MKIKQLIVILVLLKILQARDLCQEYLQTIEILHQQQESLIKEENTYYIGSKQDLLFQGCKGLQLWKYSNDQFNDPIEIQPLNHKLLYKITDIQIVQYYAFTYESQQLIFKVNQTDVEIIQDQRRLLSTDVESELHFCTDIKCSAILFYLQICLNDDFYIQQIIKDPKYMDYYLVNSSSLYKSDGLLKMARIHEMDNSVKGKSTMRLQADIAWTKLRIVIQSQLSLFLDSSDLKQISTQSCLETTFLSLNSCDPNQILVLFFEDYECTLMFNGCITPPNDEIFVQLRIPGDDWDVYFVNTTFYFVVDGQELITTPLAIDNSERGKLKALMKIDILKKMRIRFKTYLSENSLNFQKGDKEFTINSYEINCLRNFNDPIDCGDSADNQCKYQCESCPIQNLKTIRIMTIIIFFISFN